ncbi:MAG: hypothetical protein ABIR26_12485 [Ramlibacter sp.]
MLIHLQIPKTSTTSISACMREVYGERFRQFKLLDDVTAEGDVVVLRAGQSATATCEAFLREAAVKFDAISVMAPFGAHHLVGGGPHPYVTFLRKPDSRCVSFWNMQCEQAAKGMSDMAYLLESGYDFDAMLRHGPCLSIRNEQTRMLSGSTRIELTELDFEAACANLEEHFPRVGFVERHEASVAEIARHFRWRVTPAKQLNIGPAHPKRPLTEAQLEFLQETNAYDARLYEWAWKRFSPYFL